ncbi:MAG: ExbD/TolR family protein [Pseudobdellovibrio sp.]
MARRRYKMHIDHNSEFELDLAPLLAVMVKLVPVLLVSSAFAQLMIVETELPQVVQEAITREEKTEKPTVISLTIDKVGGVKVSTSKNGKENIKNIAQLSGKEFNLTELHTTLIEIKKANPEVFKIELNPADNVPYKDIVRIMDEVRKSRSNDIRFPVQDEKTGKTSTTDYMFPEVVFPNMTEG